MFSKFYNSILSALFQMIPTATLLRGFKSTPTVAPVNATCGIVEFHAATLPVKTCGIAEVHGRTCGIVEVNE